MFWSAALELKTNRTAGGLPPAPVRPLGSSYGSFSRSGSSSSLHIPQSIPEHQPVSQFASPRPEDRSEYVERAETAFARTRAALQLSEHTQTALKLLLQGDSGATKSKKSASSHPDMYSMSKIHSYSARQSPMKLKPSTPLLQAARIHGQEDEEPNPQEHEQEVDEHNYWMRERERRRAGLRKSRRRTCTPLTERATTSPLKVGVVMCSVPLLLVLGFVLFVLLFGPSAGAGAAADAASELLGLGQPPERGRIGERTGSRFTEGLRTGPPPMDDDGVLALDVAADAPPSTALRGASE
ncbi:hypothetical protein BBJ28_00024107 [Nothophytophthora sp. Chile5]|nr:hypothetical protein BBJ28_00024107 [Nothophytophthora sp. Chile5]